MAKARPRQLKVSAINISIADSSAHNKASVYRDLLRQIYASHDFVELRGDRAMAIGSMQTDPDDDNILRGVLYGITKLDRFAWFNVERHRPASDAEIGRIRVPDGMEANYREYDYEFHSKRHRLIFVTSEGKLYLSALQVRYVFEQLCQRPSIRNVFGDVNVSIEAEPKKLDEILDADDLRALSILVRRPNAGLGGFDSDFAKKLEKLGASQAQVEYKAATGESLAPDDAIRRAAKVSLSNGLVTATIRREGVTEEVSTQHYPIVETVSYTPGGKNRAIALRRAAEQLFKKIGKSQ